MTFRTIKGLNGRGVTFESALYHGFYIASVGGKLILTETPDKNAASFNTEKIAEGGQIAAETIKSAKVRKTVRMYAVGDTVEADDIRIRATLDNGSKVTIKDGIKLDLPADVTAATGKKELKVTYSYMGNEYEATVVINVVDKEYKD